MTSALFKIQRDIQVWNNMKVVDYSMLFISRQISSVCLANTEWGSVYETVIISAVLLDASGTEMTHFSCNLMATVFVLATLWVMWCHKCASVCLES